MQKIKQLNGIEYLVLPIVAMTPGVRNGSHGPVLHPEKALQASASQWNAKPVTINHPRQNGEYRAAMAEDQIGYTTGMRYENGGLRGYAYIDTATLRERDPDLLTDLENDSKLDVSIGAFTDVDLTAGELDGRAYIGTVTSYTPDHLAILPEERGACRWEHGCGIRVNSRPLLIVNATEDDEGDEDALYPREYFPDEYKETDPFERHYFDEDETDEDND